MLAAARDVRVAQSQEHIGRRDTQASRGHLVRRKRRAASVVAVSKEYEDVLIDEEDGLEDVGEPQCDHMVDPNVAEVNILARREIT